MPNLIIVSNRLPINVKKVNGELEFSQSIGGVATGLAAYAQRRNSKWIGWPGIVSDDLTEAETQTIIKRLKKDHCYPVFLTQKQIDEYYGGFSNTILWPYFHNLPTKFDNHERYWAMYRRVNQLFAEVVTALSQPRSTIWVHDYLLMLVPEMIRAERPHDNIGFFLHCPFPEAVSYKDLPHGKNLLQGLLGANLIGMHTPSYVNNFLDSCDVLKVGSVTSSQIVLPNQIVEVTDFPLGIDYTKYAEADRLPMVKAEVKKLRKKYRKYKIILAFDRLDLTKGFVERLRAYRQFLEENPRQHRKVKMIMVAAPTRTELKAYQNLKNRVEKLVNEINGQYGTRHWQPIDFIFKALPFEQVTAMYQIADVAFITPVMDGMNLMAKEYIAAKRNKNGVLILSQTAGAAEELTDALLVDPARPKTLVTALTRAVTMRPKELRDRLETMQDHLSTHTVHDWAHSFMKSVQQPADGLPKRVKRLERDARTALLKDYRKAERRLIILDYDGVLAEFRSHPQKAAPTPALHRRLRKLSAVPGNEILVNSGRSRADLEEWFGDLSIALASEHGALIKPLGKDWRKVVSPPSGWKKVIRPVLEKYAIKTPGAFVEEKETTLVWHYRKASPYYVQKNMVILRRALKAVIRSYGLGIFSGNNILEIKPLDTHKGTVINRWLRHKYDFIMAIGDDYTDEDMFKALPPEAYTIKVGPGTSAARFRLASVDETVNLLGHLN